MPLVNGSWHHHPNLGPPLQIRPTPAFRPWPNTKVHPAPTLLSARQEKRTLLILAVCHGSPEGLGGCQSSLYQLGGRTQSQSTKTLSLQIFTGNTESGEKMCTPPFVPEACKHKCLPRPGPGSGLISVKCSRGEGEKGTPVCGGGIIAHPSPLPENKLFMCNPPSFKYWQQTPEFLNTAEASAFQLLP